MMRTERRILADLEDARTEYQTRREKNDLAGAEKVHADVKGFMEELSATLSEGAVNCSVCDTAPIGMQRRPGIYEVGCRVCPVPARPTEGEVPEGAMTRAFGETPAAAVAVWNAQQKAAETDG